MNILALDLGNHTGYALSSGGLLTKDVGTWTLGNKKEVSKWAELRMDRRCDVRPGRLLANIKEIHGRYPIDWIVFEDVEFATTLLQAHLWASLRTAAWMMADLGVQFECLNVKSLKKFATGEGDASKAVMTKWIRFKCDEFKNRFTLLKGEGLYDTVTAQDIDDNAVDALHLIVWARNTLRNIKPSK